MHVHHIRTIGLLLGMLPASALVHGQEIAVKFTRRDLREPSANHVVYTDNGKTLAASVHPRDQPMSIRFFDVAENKRVGEFNNKPFSAFACSPDGKTIALGAANKKIELWDRASGKLKAELEGHTIHVKYLSFSPDGAKLVTSSSDNSGRTDGKVFLWDVAKGLKVADLTDGLKTKGSFASAFSPDGKMIGFGGGRASYGTLHLWDVEAGNVKHTLRSGLGKPFNSDVFFGVAAMAFTRDGKCFVSGSGGDGDKKNLDKYGQLKVWDAETGKLLGAWNASYHLIWSLAISPDGKLIASSSNEPVVRIWNTETGKEIATLDGGWSQCFSVAFSPDGRTLAAAGAGGGLAVWDIEMGK